MPSRKTIVAEEQKKAPAKKSGGKKATAAEAPETDAAETGKKLVTKSPLQEKFKKFLAAVDPEYPSKIVEMMQRKVTGESAEDTADIVFATFSPNGEADADNVDLEYNKEVIKNILFYYHTAPESTKAGGKVECLEIVPPSEDSAAHILGYYEM